MHFIHPPSAHSIDWLIDCSIYRSIDWSIDRLIDWLISFWCKFIILFHPWQMPKIGELIQSKKYWQGVQALLDALSLLYDTNNRLREESAQIPYETFYIPEITQKVRRKKKYKKRKNSEIFSQTILYTIVSGQYCHGLQELARRTRQHPSTNTFPTFSSLPSFAPFIRSLHSLPSFPPFIHSLNPLPSSAPLIRSPHLLPSFSPSIFSLHLLPSFAPFIRSLHFFPSFFPPFTPFLRFLPSLPSLVIFFP